MTDTKYHIITDRSQIKETLIYIAKRTATHTDAWVALDLETTALDPTLSKSYVRLAQFYANDLAVVLDFGAGDANCWYNMAKYMSGGNYIVFNAKFERAWLSYGGARNFGTWDVALLRAAIQGGGGGSLKITVAQDLDMELYKDEQKSLWSAEQLRTAQYDYAIQDAYATWRLWERWIAAVDEGRWHSFVMFNSLIPATLEMEWAGMKLDTSAHRDQIAHWTAEQSRLQNKIHNITNDEITNINSGAQWNDYLVAHIPYNLLANWTRTNTTGHLSMTADEVRFYAAAWRTEGGNPLSDLLDAKLDYAKLTTYIHRYGHNLITKANMSPDGRLHARFIIAGAITGRYSAISPPLQQLPRDYDMGGDIHSIRKSICAENGNLLVSLDYSGIEVRIAAELAGDKRLLNDVIYGDPHTEVAETMTGRKINKNNPTDKAIRSKAKGGTFALLYGAGATGVATAMKTDIEAGADFIAKWKSRYPLTFNLRHDVANQVAANDGYLRCVDGGTIYMGDYAGLTRCANYPVQRAAFVVMARALIRFKNTLDKLRHNGKQIGTMLIATIHDQIIAEATEIDAPECIDLMRRDMIAAYKDVFPHSITDNLLEGGIGKNWSSLE